MIRLPAILSVPLYFLCLSLPGAAWADVSEQLPQKIDPGDSWLFYAHSSAVYKKSMTKGWRKKTEKFSTIGFRVITEERFAGDEENAYAENVISQINTLLKSGVPARNIFVGGFSRGAVIALDVANRIKNPGLGFILIAGCESDASVDADIKGRFISVYGSDDEKDYGSCAGLLQGKPGVKFSEIAFQRKGHTFFHGLKSDWFDPIRAWMKSTD